MYLVNIHSLVFLAVAARITGTSLQVKLGFACSISAIIPATNGQAADVPLYQEL